jgi:YidC/Oxa1 family membrane protein insertase
VNIFDIVIVQPIFNMLLFIYSLIPGGDFGIAVIIFTILVRLALWPLVKKQLHQTKAMQKMQPELAKIKKRTKGNRQAESVQMMELYKQHDISPFRSIGILFIQLPIFIALYQVIQIFTLHIDQVAKYTYGFMLNLGPVKELIANPSSFNMDFFGFIDLTQKAISTNPFAINIALFILAVVAVITQYIMSKQTMPKQGSEKRLRDILSEAADGKEADQSEMNAIVMNKMMKFLPIMMFFVMISLPGALALYYTVSNLVAVIQQRSILKQDAEEMIEIADKADMGQGKKATAKARAKQAQEGNITRITAKDTTAKKSK